MYIKEGFLNRRMINDYIPTQIFKWLRICHDKGVNCVPCNNTDTNWTIDNIKTKDITHLSLKRHLSMVWMI